MSMQSMVELKGVTKRFTKPISIGGRVARAVGGKTTEEIVHAVSDIDLEIKPGEVVGLVGESGCGKSTLGRMIAGISSLSDGSLRYRGVELSEMSRMQRRDYALGVQMIFQDPMSSLNPRLRVVDIVGEAPVVHGLSSRRERDYYVADLMRKVGLDPTYMRRLPHQFSGGQRQRIGIARALALKPKMLVCDETVAALDVSIQAQVLNLFLDLRDEMHLAYLFISHNLGVVEHVSDRVVIMYLGRIVETAPTKELFKASHHPYTQALIAELPSLSPGRRQYKPIKGELPSPLSPPSGCAFHPRCPYAMPICSVERPALKQIAGGHVSACHLN
ncbi:oligopeptide/dipeptide ABC transporter ATP-binding protein [Tianweitania sp.]|uniref:ABC transporter ATP-binding protein n=1 Tax=Tianweitania sp. TaxID=2021634 RepID=UPI002898AA87|nr:oligopeptide/dipeptide ABC transporter ATP-binding protein [Tianweitania sp.]